MIHFIKLICIFSIYFISLFSGCNNEKIMMFCYYNEEETCGYITLDHINGAICDIHISLFDVDSVVKFNPDIKSYVVWIESLSNQFSNIGKLHSATGGPSFEISGHINSICITKPCRIFVTEELKPDVVRPADFIIASTKKF